MEEIDRVAAGAKPLWPLPPARDRTLDAPDRRIATDSPTSVHTGSRILVLERAAPGLLEFLERARGRKSTA